MKGNEERESKNIPQWDRCKNKHCNEGSSMTESTNLKKHNSFPCTKCGLCCRSISKSIFYKNLDRGDGTCIHLSESDNSCKIYESRPSECRIDTLYNDSLSKIITKKDFYSINAKICHSIQKSNGIPEEERIITHIIEEATCQSH